MPRTALEIVQAAAPRLALDVPGELFASNDKQLIELRTLLNECAVRIAREHDWEALLVLDTDSGDGTTTEYALPADHWRMPKESQVWSTRWQRPLLHITPEESLRLDVRNYDLVQGTWTIIGGSMVYSPALASGEDAKWYYITANVVAPAVGSRKPRFTLDTDTFRLDDRTLELTLIWQWREQKGMPYGEDMVNAERALAQAIMKDRGARMVTQTSRANVRAKVAYPWSIQP